MVHLYHLNVKPSNSSIMCTAGVFDKDRYHDIAIAKQGELELARIGPSGHCNVIRKETLFGQIRCLAPHRSPGSSRDSLAILSDSGSLSILSFNSATSRFDVTDSAVFGKSGARRSVAGDYIACDPAGRAIMVAAIEKYKLIYIMAKEGNSASRLSSPIEAHKLNAVTHSLCAIDVAYDNPLFASIEATNNSSGKHLVWYELDLGINHVTRRIGIDLPSSAHLLIPLPKGQEGSNKLLICCDNFLMYCHGPAVTPIRCSYPRRLDTPENFHLVISSFAVQILRSSLLILIQSDLGDLYKVFISGSSTVLISYFESLPRAVSIVIVKPGFLYASFEVGGSAVYQFSSLGNEDTLDESNTSAVPFRPRGLKNISVRHDIPSASPMLDMFIKPANDGKSAHLKRGIISACGQSTRSSIRSISLATAFTELALTDLPGKPSGIWTLKEGSDDKYIVVSFTDATLVLVVGEDITEVSDSGFSPDVRTIHASILPDRTKVQISSSWVRHFGAENKSEWRPRRTDNITCAASNGHQIIIALSTGKIVLLEQDDIGNFTEVAERSVGGLEVYCLAIETERNRKSRGFLAIMGLSDGSVRVMSLEPGNKLKQLSAQTLPAAPQSCCLSNWADTIRLFVGLKSGSCFRCKLDSVTGDITMPVIDSMGTTPCSVTSLELASEAVVLAVGSSTQIYRLSEGKISRQLTQFQSTEYFDFVCSFSSAQCPNGLLAVFSSSLSISVVDNITGSSNGVCLPVSYTPRRFCQLPSAQSPHGLSELVAVIETDHNAYNDETRSEIKRELSLIELEVEDPAEPCTDSSIGTFIAGVGKWASCIRVVNYNTMESVFKLDLDVDETAIAFTICRFNQLKDMRPCLVVATAKGVGVNNRSSLSSYLKTYLYDASYHLQLVHVTQIDETVALPSRVIEMSGRLLVAFSGIGLLRLYELGKRKLLLKCEYRDAQQSGYSWLGTRESRIFAGDMSKGIQVLEFDEVNHALKHICRDICNRWVTTCLILDAEVSQSILLFLSLQTIIAGDKFGNVTVLRVPPSDTRSISDSLKPDKSGASMEHLCQFYCGDIITSLQLARSTSGAEVIVAGTLGGSVRVFLPLTDRRTLKILKDVETEMRRTFGSLISRDHFSFRSSYFPCKAVIDGELCDRFPDLDRLEMSARASNLGLKPDEICRVLDQIRNDIL